MANGKPVRNARDWTRRRAEIKALIEEYWFGRAPGSPAARITRAMRVEQCLDAGIAIATFDQHDLAPDFTGTEGMGVKALLLKPGQTQPAPGEWGAIAGWAWGASRCAGLPVGRSGRRAVRDGHHLAT